jgi:hypothetical protein
MIARIARVLKGHLFDEATMTRGRFSKAMRDGRKENNPFQGIEKP